MLFTAATPSRELTKNGDKILIYQADVVNQLTEQLWSKQEGPATSLHSMRKLYIIQRRANSNICIRIYVFAAAKRRCTQAVLHSRNAVATKKD